MASIARRPARRPDAWRRRFGVGVSMLMLFLTLLGAARPTRAETIGERIHQRLEERRATREAAQTRRAARPGTHEYLLEHGGLTRKYLVHVPGSYRAGRPAPLVFAFHGGGGDARFMADDERYGLISKAEEAGFIAVFPNGYSRLPGGRLATWNAGACCGDARDRDVDDVGFVRATLAEIRSRLDIDPGRIYATGMSNGGMLSHRLACEMADELSAVASVAGTDGTHGCSPSRPISVLHIHARNDDHVLFEGGAGENAFRDRGKVTSFVSVPDTVARWSSRNRCEARPVRTLSAPGAYCDTYGDCAGGVQVQLCVTETGGHSWPGAEKVRRGKEPASQAISANDVMWAFFEANPRSPARQGNIPGAEGAKDPRPAAGAPPL